MLVMVACSSTSSMTSLAIFMLPPPAVAGLFSDALLAEIMKRVPATRGVPQCRACGHTYVYTFFTHFSLELDCVLIRSCVKMQPKILKLFPMEKHSSIINEFRDFAQKNRPQYRTNFEAIPAQCSGATTQLTGKLIKITWRCVLGCVDRVVTSRG